MITARGTVTVRGTVDARNAVTAVQGSDGPEVAIGPGGGDRYGG